LALALGFGLMVHGCSMVGLELDTRSKSQNDFQCFQEVQVIPQRFLKGVGSSSVHPFLKAGRGEGVGWLML
jgi:hypothetical protein